MADDTWKPEFASTKVPEFPIAEVITDDRFVQIEDGTAVNVDLVIAVLRQRNGTTAIMTTGSRDIFIDAPYDVVLAAITGSEQ